MTPTNRQWLLPKRPVGLVKESDFELHEAPVPVPAENEMLVRTTVLAFEPAMRGWIDDAPNHLPPVGIGEVMRGVSVAEVVESNAPGYAPGDLVSGTTGWQEYAIAGPGVRNFPEGTDPRVALSVLGMTGPTAWYGLRRDPRRRARAHREGRPARDLRLDLPLQRREASARPQQLLHAHQAAGAHGGLRDPRPLRPRGRGCGGPPRPGAGGSHRVRVRRPARLRERSEDAAAPLRRGEPRQAAAGTPRRGP